MQVINLIQRDVTGGISGLDLLQIVQALQAQTHSNQYHGASSNLQHHQKIAQPALARSADGHFAV